MDCNIDSITDCFRDDCEPFAQPYDWGKKEGGQTVVFMREFKEWPLYVGEPDYFLKGHEMFECNDGFYFCYPSREHGPRWSAGYVEEMIERKILKRK